MSLFMQMFQCATSSTAGGSSDERLIVVGQVMSTLPGALRSKLTKKLSELAEARQNNVAKRAGFKGLDTIAVAGKSSPNPKAAAGIIVACSWTYADVRL